MLGNERGYSLIELMLALTVIGLLAAVAAPKVSHVLAVSRTQKVAADLQMLDAAAGVPGSSMVTVMARNGVNFGIRLAGTGDRWFEAPANPVEGLFFPGYGVEDAAADLDESRPAVLAAPVVERA